MQDLQDIVSAEYKGQYRILITFEDGKSGIVDFSQLLSFRGIFEPIKSIDAFKNFYIDKELGTIAWPNGADFAPDTLYHIISNY